MCTKLVLTLFIFCSALPFPAVSQPELVVLLDNNYGLPGTNNHLKMGEGSVGSTSSTLSNNNMNLVNKLSVSKIVNGTNIQPVTYQGPRVKQNTM